MVAGAGSRHTEPSQTRVVAAGSHKARHQIGGASRPSGVSEVVVNRFLKKPRPRKWQSEFLDGRNRTASLQKWCATRALYEGYAGTAMDDESNTVRDLKRLAADHATARGWDDLHNPKDLAIGIATESAELLQLFRFKSTAEVEALLRQTQFREAAEDELGDIVFLLARFASKCGYDLSRALQRKLSSDDERHRSEQR